ncbi:SPFH domain-containing protein [Haloplasma contractile]|uniref:Ornithine decarboxylase protein n=1 Tax=Haloplasma contractile SSD-17B TaxID=1033810 RepID=U2ECE3_9MOLU|nr:SPFH domain-containing protein [Haloplasma contractile]ERJ12441.1 ornithine decarboxylase protein [Haloplasma contractile SSD-17B]
MGPYIIIGFVVFIVLLAAAGFRIVPQSESFILERLGQYQATWQSGLHWKWPLIEKVAKRVSLKEQVVDFQPQPVITRDNVTMQIDTVVFFQITEPKLFAYEVARPLVAIENLTATTLRNIIGELELDETLTSRDVINSKMRIILDEVTDPWGIKVSRVEVKNILPPRDIQEAMEKQMRAERERRAAILTSEGKRESAIRIAEGDKRSAILRAEADKESQIRRAEGEAEAILQVQQATAEGLKLLNKAAPTEAILKLKSYEAFVKAADGKATKLIIPSEIQNLGSLLTSAAEMVKTTNEEANFTEVSEEE